MSCLAVALIIILISPVSASIFTINDVQAVISVKTISTAGIISKDTVPDTDLKISGVQTVQLQLSKIAKQTEVKYVQLYPDATVLISSDFAGVTDVMQISTKPGYPLMEIYYGYQKSILQPWRYYFRIETIDKDNAYVIYGDFDRKSEWLGKIPRSTYDAIISDGKIPDWSLISKGSKEVIPDAEKI